MKINDLRWTDNGNGTTRRRLMQVLAPCVLLFAAFGAHAECNLVTGQNFPVRNSVALNGTINVPRDVAPGYQLAKFTYRPPSEIKFAHCSTAGTLVVDGKLASTPHLPPDLNKVYPTNVPGIGVKMVADDEGLTFPFQISIPTNGGQYWYWDAGSSISYVFVTTGPVSSGRITAADLPIASLEVRGSPWWAVNASGSVDVVALSCKTPDVTVEMGTVRAADMKSVGATSAPVSFKVAANNCPAGISKITYQFKAPNGVLDAAAGVVALSDDSTARGFALKLMDENGAALRFDSPYPINVAPTGGSYALPMKAAYYRTSQTISSGSANAILTFTMSYN
ncbi:fimbrial protein [Burkholderia ambifaria]|uniref:fimbrial protein n=1 Tax=Burkholderia ambifaria TaxID=152480 RepID=UPI001B9ACEA1|nr:fimbrial protein [Burkholderia ambifaria]MBR8252223.1 type 1 fimbrial protein [Burkholderia ambifaria]